LKPFNYALFSVSLIGRLTLRSAFIVLFAPETPFKVLGAMKLQNKLRSLSKKLATVTCFFNQQIRPLEMVEEEHIRDFYFISLEVILLFISIVAHLAFAKSRINRLLRRDVYKGIALLIIQFFSLVFLGYRLSCHYGRLRTEELNNKSKSATIISFLRQ
jgi:hypothetical protein